MPGFSGESPPAGIPIHPQACRPKPRTRSTPSTSATPCPRGSEQPRRSRAWLPLLPSFASTPTVCFSTRLSWSADSIARKSLRRSGYSAALNKFAHRVVPTDRHTSQPTLALDQETRVALEVRLRRTRHRVHLRHLRQLSPHRILDQQPVVKVHRLLPLFARKRRFPVALEQRARNQQALASRRSDRPFTSNFTTSGFSHSSSGVIDPTVNSIPPGNNACTFLIRHAPSNKPSGQLLPCGAKVLSVLSC